MRTLTRSVVAIAAATFCLLGAVGSVEAATFTVTKTTDTADGTCNADCSLREAITAANAAAGADVVSIPAGTFALTIVGADEDDNANGDLDVKATGGGLTITGAGMAATTISDTLGGERVLDLVGSLTFSLDGVTITGGGAAGIDGGGLSLDGGGTYSVTNTRVTGNTGAGGAGIFLEGTLTIADSRIDANTGTANGGGLRVDGGSATIDRVEFADNVVTGAVSDGGALFVQGNRSAFIHDSTFANNKADVNGGAIHGNVNSTVGMRNVTLVGNVADADANGQGVGGGFYAEGVGSNFTVANMLIASNQRGAATDDCVHEGTFTPQGRNLVSSTAFCGGWQGADLVDVNPGIGTFGAHGGPSRTVPLLATSPAIDAATASLCDRPKDQRGFARTIGTGCDIGAVETRATTDLALTANPTVATTSSSVDVVFELENVGIDPAFGAGFTVTIPSGMTATHTGNGVSCTGSPVITCTSAGAGLNPGESAQATFTVRSSTPATYTLSGSTVADATDLVTSNNAASALVTITAAAGGGGGTGTGGDGAGTAGAAPLLTLKEAGKLVVVSKKGVFKVTVRCPKGVSGGSCNAALVFDIGIARTARAAKTVRATCAAKKIPAGTGKVVACTIPKRSFAKLARGKHRAAVTLTGTAGATKKVAKAALKLHVPRR